MSIAHEDHDYCSWRSWLLLMKTTIIAHEDHDYYMITHFACKKILKRIK